MKKIVAFSMVAIILAAAFTVFVSADTNFSFKERSLGWKTSDYMTVSWNEEEIPESTTVEVEEVTVNKHSYSVIAADTGTLTVDLTSLGAGIYSPAVYHYVVNNEEKSERGTQPVIKAGTATVKLSISFNADGSVIVKASDNAGTPIADYPFLLSIGSMSDLSYKTSSNGTFVSREIAEVNSEVSCIGVGKTISGVTYTKTDKVTAVRAPATTTVPTKTSAIDQTTFTGESTTESTESTSFSGADSTASTNAGVTTSPSYVTVAGVATTAKDGDKIAISLYTDEHILELFGMTAEEFTSQARLYLSAADYTTLAGRSGDTLVLNMLSSAVEPTPVQLQKAISGNDHLKTFQEEERKTVAFDLSFLLVKRADGSVVPLASLPISGTYTVRLPVPESMKDCEALAFTLFDGDTLRTPTEVKITDDCFSVQINSLEPYVLIGFQSEEAKRAGGISVLQIVLFLVALLLLGGAGAILYFFIWRKPAPEPAKEEIAFTPVSYDENDIFSGRTDVPQRIVRPKEEDN